jgi:hypothetical protein
MNIAPTYSKNPFLGPNDPYGKLLSDPTKVPEKLCAQFQSLIASVPSGLAGTGASRERTEAAIAWFKTRLYDGLNLGIDCPITYPAWNDTDANPLVRFSSPTNFEGLVL